MKTAAAVILALILCATHLVAGDTGEAVSVRIVGDDGHNLPTYPVKIRRGTKKGLRRGGQRGALPDRSDQPSGPAGRPGHRRRRAQHHQGEKSWLKNNERMYILEPYGMGTFAGWRTGQDRINRFYFTDVPDSYAAAFGDESATGVIAVVAYPEQRRYEPPQPLAQNRPFSGKSLGGMGAGAADKALPAPAAPSGERKAAQAPASKRADAYEGAGTGYGGEEYSPSYTVAFEAEKRAIESIYIKYEWRSTLCRLGVVDCAAPRHRPNRLWDNAGYAPPPPRAFYR